MVSIYWPAMATSQMSPDAQTPGITGGRPLDTRALARVLSRLNRAAAAPWLHVEVARRMAERLPVIKLKPDRVIDWGAFVGGSQECLRQAYPAARVMAVEPDADRRNASAAALRGAWWSPSRWLGADAPTLAPEAVPAADARLLWSNMHLHAVADPQALLARWHTVLQTDGFLMFSTLGPGSLRPLRDVYERLGWQAPFAPFVDMHDLGDMLVEAGFADPVVDQEHIQLSWASGLALLEELRTLGGNVSSARHPGLRTPGWRLKLASLLEAECGQADRVVLRFEIVYGHAFKPAPRPRVTSQTVIPVEDLRAMARTRRIRP
jgi:malonyl-CoA O-methyltransferase